MESRVDQCNISPRAYCRIAFHVLSIREKNGLSHEITPALQNKIWYVIFTFLWEEILVVWDTRVLDMRVRENLLRFPIHRA